MHTHTHTHKHTRQEDAAVAQRAVQHRRRQARRRLQLSPQAGRELVGGQAIDLCVRVGGVGGGRVGLVRWEGDGQARVGVRGGVRGR